MGLLMTVIRLQETLAKECHKVTLWDGTFFQLYQKNLNCISYILSIIYEGSFIMNCEHFHLNNFILQFIATTH